LISQQENFYRERVTQIVLCRPQNEFQQTARAERQRQGRAEDYQLQLSTKNRFLPLTSFPPLPYKTAVTNPAPSSTQNNSYITRHIEHLFLTNCKPMPIANISHAIIHKTFG